MYRCPHCDAPLSRWTVLSTGPLDPKMCASCGKLFFGGGLPAAVAILGLGLYVSVIILSMQRGLLPLLIVISVCIFAAGWLAVRAQPVSGQFKWRETAKILSIPVLLYAALNVTPVIANALIHWRML